MTGSVHIREMAQAKGRKGRESKGKGLTQLLNANPKGTGEKAKGLRLCMIVTLDPERPQTDTQPAPVSC